MTSSDPARLFVPVWNYTSSSPMLYFLELSCLRGFSTLTFDLGHRLHRKRQGFTSDGFTWKALHLELNHVYMVLLALWFTDKKTRICIREGRFTFQLCSSSKLFFCNYCVYKMVFTIVTLESDNLLFLYNVEWIDIQSINFIQALCLTLPCLEGSETLNLCWPLWEPMNFYSTRWTYCDV